MLTIHLHSTISSQTQHIKKTHVLPYQLLLTPTSVLPFLLPASTTTSAFFKPLHHTLDFSLSSPFLYEILWFLLWILHFPFLLISTAPLFFISGMNYLFTSFSALNVSHLLAPSLNHSQTNPPASWLQNIRCASLLHQIQTATWLSWPSLLPVF